MNTRQPIQPSNQPAVLYLAFSSSRKRFIAGLADGFRCFRTDNCLTTYNPTLPVDGGIAVVAALDDRYVAFVGGGRSPAGKSDVVIFWDAVLGKETARFHLHEPVLGVRLSGRWMVVVLRERTVVFEYQELQPRSLSSPHEDGSSTEKVPDPNEALRAPNKVKALYPTSTNDHALANLRGDLLVLPAQSTGQVQLIPLSGGSKRVLRAHNTSLRCLAISDDGTLLATASEQGTLIRVYSISNVDQIAEFRRGSDHAIIFSLAFSPGNRWLACTSDKGTLHIFDLRPPDPAAEIHTAKDRSTKDRHSLPHHRKTPSYAAHRLSAGGLALERDSLSGGPSAHSSPPTSRAGSSGRAGTPGTPTAYQGGSVQEYYGLRPPPASATPPSTSGSSGVSALASAFKASGFAPRILRDVRSVASIPFHLGDERLHWQGGAAFSWTTTPGGGRKRVRNAVLGLPGEASGRPPKGVLGFAPREVGESDEEGARVYVLGGGGDARWEVFEVLPAEGGGWGVVNRGFRRYLTRQFVE
ncbi:Phosphatidylinositol 3,5-bisphosphate-binding protein [Friedmanniomyces endolithicus]|nr:Phosphatidylinositol 3,5-bisphosphate-binding protein [Friedmanniomyces endolithicus]KAK0828427.1 Phosphatidylinositol 3,5-bisphosphate-binding protein [Friedmanniomyces endolithicus]